ncbi:CAP domain-containing protein [Amantichitinum ursilacus]|uniref:SCP domain-containing protein n=1 Tax=Amantichitinum ursilacus TaxID=857265 RepID=A0A0N0GNJ5_9NEIS|nr:CAP domain-containing protein [Amantichitinum ursilacus]KPC52775.1 hypothetical protein WG78_13045 [Amantichitinum ursilacus]
MTHNATNKTWLVLPIALILAACGGGGGGDDGSTSGGSSNNTTAGSTATPTPTPTASSGATPTPTPTATPTPTPSSADQTSFAAINTSNRSEVIARYQDGLVPLKATTFSWTGNVSTCTPGDTPLNYKNAEVRLVNYYRAMAGLPGNVTLSLDESARAQAAALMMDANDQLSHAPTTSWICYTAVGAAAAGKSNLALSSGALNSGVPGMGGIGGIGLYVGDAGVTSLGHRRWVLYSRLSAVGTGDTPSANALYVIDNVGPVYTPANGTPWPPAGYVPRPVASPSQQWSFSYPGADFSNSTVALTDDANNAIATSNVGKLDNGYGDNTFSWNISSSATGWDRSPGDTKINVTVGNVLIGGVARSFSYTVTFITP